MQILDTIYQLLGIQPQEFQSPVPSPTPTPTPDPFQKMYDAGWRKSEATPTPTPVPQRQPEVKGASTAQDVERRIRAGMAGSPGANYIQQIMQGINKYPFLQNNPYLVPQIMNLETSMGKNVTRDNNLMNWGINVPGNNEIFANMTPEQVLETAISGLGERSSYYDQFRTGQPMTAQQLLEFAKVYEPKNQSYGPNLIEGIKYLEGL